MAVGSCLFCVDLNFSSVFSFFSGKLDNQFLIRFYKERLMSKPCQNQGFILDGFPKTEEHAKELFARRSLLNTY
jgi:hypothetical protein